MRELLPPARTKPWRECMTDGIPKSIRLIPTYPKVTYPERHGSRKMEVSGEIIKMPQKLMDVLMLGRCSHEFSWPRRAANGEYYQVCMLCATAYEYDWKTMRRGGRVDEPLADTDSGRRRSGQKQPAWMLFFKQKTAYEITR